MIRIRKKNTRQRMRFWIWIRYLLLFGLISSPCFSTSGKEELAKKIKNIEKHSHTVIGMSAIYIENNDHVNHNAKQHFFMASTIKFPIALAFLHRVDEKQDSLKRLIPLDYNNSVPGSGFLYQTFEKKKIALSSEQILKYMLTMSDNSASDTLLQAVNGPEYVTKRMYELGMKQIVVNRSILEMLLDTNHVDHTYLHYPHTVYSWKKIFSNTPLKEKALAWQRFQNDLRDTTTPEDMAKLLVKVYRRQALSASSTQLLMRIMEQCRTGRSRIKGLLPAHVKVAHKTGTWGIDERRYIQYPASRQLYRFASDIGIITLPNNKGHIAIAIYVKSKSASDYPRTRAIALASRAIYDHYMKQRPTAITVGKENRGKPKPATKIASAKQKQVRSPVNHP